MSNQLLFQIPGTEKFVLGFVSVDPATGLPTGGAVSPNGEITTTVVYRVKKTWAGLAVGSTIYWVQTDKEDADPTFKWLTPAGVQVVDPPDATYYEPTVDNTTFAHQHFVDATGVLFYYVSRPGAASAAYKVSDGSGFTPTTPVRQVAQSSGGIQPVPLQGNANHTYTLPAAPSSLTGAYLLRNGVSYSVNGVDWTVAGTTLTVVNPQARAALNEIFFFNWFA